MPDFKHDSFCGLYCGACDILIAFKKSLESGVEPKWIELPKEFQSLPFDTKKSKVRCFGCKTDDVFEGCSHCLIRKCAVKKTEIDTCLDCRMFPCWRHKLTGLFKKIMKLEKKLPHQKDIRPNMEYIKKHGIAKWMKEQEEKWRCKFCGKQLTWYHAECFDCKDQTKKN